MATPSGTPTSRPPEPPVETIIAQLLAEVDPVGPSPAVHAHRSGPRLRQAPPQGLEVVAALDLYDSGLEVLDAPRLKRPLAGFFGSRFSPRGGWPWGGHA